MPGPYYVDPGTGAVIDLGTGEVVSPGNPLEGISNPFGGTASPVSPDLQSLRDQLQGGGTDTTTTGQEAGAGGDTAALIALLTGRGGGGSGGGAPMTLEEYVAQLQAQRQQQEALGQFRQGLQQPQLDIQNQLAQAQLQQQILAQQAAQANQGWQRSFEQTGQNLQAQLGYAESERADAAQRRADLEARFSQGGMLGYYTNQYGEQLPTLQREQGIAQQQLAYLGLQQQAAAQAGQLGLGEQSAQLQRQQFYADIARNPQDIISSLFLARGKTPPSVMPLGQMGGAQASGAPAASQGLPGERVLSSIQSQGMQLPPVLQGTMAQGGGNLQQQVRLPTANYLGQNTNLENQALQGWYQGLGMTDAIQRGVRMGQVAPIASTYQSQINPYR